MKSWKPEAIILAIGMLIMGYFIKNGLDTFAGKDRVVTVKGLAEMEVPANKVTWPLMYKEVGNEQTLGASLDVQEERLRKYCNQMGYNIIDNIPYREDESAKTFEKRPVIQGIMNYIRKTKVE